MNPSLNFPPALLAQHIAVLGKTGSGKTFAVKGLVERLLTEGRRVGIVDPTGAWWGLRSSSDGRGPGFPILVLGGDHGDLPLPALSGAAVARLLVEGVNLVADTSQLTVGERTRWFIDFAGTLYRLNKAPLHLVLDEAHNFAPKGKIPDPDTGKMLHAANTLASGGRSRGIRLAMITQRPQKLHNDALTSADTLIALRVLAPHDRMAVEDWIKGCGDTAAGKEVLNSLASLQRGEGWIWYPEGAYLERVKFPPIRTFDSSATPVDGKSIAAPKRAAEIDLAAIRSALADAVKEAEATDPKLLRKRIAELEKQLASRPTGAPKDDTAPVSALRDELASVTRNRDGLQLVLNGWHDRARRIAATLLESVGDVALSTKAPEKLASAVVRNVARAPAAPAAAPAPAGPVADGVTAPQQKILDAVAQMNAFGVASPNKLVVAVRAGVSPKSSGYANNLGALRSKGLIEYPAGGCVALTGAGSEIANHPAKAPTLADLHAGWLAMVTRPQAAILAPLIEHYPSAVPRDDLAALAGVSASSSGYANNLGFLRTLGVITYRESRSVAATDILFPGGRRG